MLDTKIHAYNLLASAIGANATVLYNYPNDFNALPVVTYLETNCRMVRWFDNAPYAYESTIQVDVWANVSTTALVKLIDTAFAADYYTLDFSSDVPEPDVKIFHRVLRYRRAFTADDLD